MAAILHIDLLGDFRLLYDETPVAALKTARLQSLLAYLVLHRDAPQPRSKLAFLFWPDSTESQAHTNLRNLLHHLRRTLPKADLFLQADAGILGWRPDAPFMLDVADFESALARVARAEESGHEAGLRAALEEAVALYRGDLLPGSYEDWVLSERHRQNPIGGGVGPMGRPAGHRQCRRPLLCGRGRVGLCPVPGLAQQGMATSAGSLVEAGAQPTYGDMRDRASLNAACEGIETLITTANSAMRGGEDNVETVDRVGNRNLIDAARAAGVRQFIFTSVLGADVNNPFPFIQAKAETEAYLRGSGVPYTILAPNFFIESWVGMVVGMPLGAGQPVTLVGEGRRMHSFVSAVDVAAFATAAVGHPAAVDQHLAIGGPETLSWCDVVTTFERVMGREIPVRFISPGEPVPGVPEMVTHMLPALETFDSPIPMAETARTFGVRLTTLEEYVRRQFGGGAV